MIKKLAAAGTLAAAAGGIMLLTAPAHADTYPGAGFWQEPQNVQILPIQTCRGIDVAGIGAAIHNILGVDDEQGACVNGPVITNHG